MIEATYGASLTLAAGSTSMLHTNVMMHLYKEISELENTYSVDMLSIQSIGDDENHARIMIFRVISKRGDGESIDTSGVFVAGVAILSEDQITTLAHPNYKDVADALAKAATEGGRALGKIGVMVGGNAEELFASAAGPAVDNLLADILGSDDTKKEEES